MGHRRRFNLLVRNGEPLDSRIATLLDRMAPRVIRQFPSLHDETALIEVLEEAGRRVAEREERGGRLANLAGYTWVTVRSVATSFIRRGAARLVQKTIVVDASQIIASQPAAIGNPDDIEREILLREVLAKLTAEERRVCDLKQAGFSSQEIARQLGRSVVSVDTIFSRAKARLRRLLVDPIDDAAEE